MPEERPDTPPGDDTLDHIYRDRLEKLRRFEAAGHRAYPTTFPRTHTAREVVDRFDSLEGRQVAVAGRWGVVRSIGKNLAFVPLTDGSGRVQVVAHPRDLPDAAREVYDAIDPGDFVGVRGAVMKTRTGEISVEATDFALLTKTLRNPPEKWHGVTDVETRSRQRYLDLMANEATRQVFLVRSHLISAIRRFLDERGFVEVETPILQPIPGGGAARPFATESWALDSTMYLRIALELYLKRCIVGGIERVYEIGKNFRNEGVSFKHNPEFTMLELYQAYADYNDVMALTEEMVAHAARTVVGSAAVKRGDATLDFTPPWRRRSLREAIREHSGVDYQDHPDAESLRAAAAARGLQPDRTWSRGKVMDELLTAFVEPKLQQPTFLVDYPTDFPGSTLAKGKPDNPAEVERFEAFAGGMEIANAFSELNDPRVQRERFDQQVRARQQGDEEAQPFDADFLLALEHGMPPTGGLGVGIDRLAMLLTDQHAIRDVILFPQLRPRG
jgi:lysyl-tRNA synthetase class 2